MGVVCLTACCVDMGLNVYSVFDSRSFGAGSRCVSCV